VEPPPIDFQPPVPPPPRPLPEAAAAKLDQLKDLYFTAQVIGEDALGKHFDQVSERQREIIKDFFKQSEPSE
jgi:ABC-type transporter MlaC component